MKKWNIWNTEDLYEMLHYISVRYGDDCSKCKTTCCANQMLEIHNAEAKVLAKHLKMQPSEFRFKYTKTKENYMKCMDVKAMSDRAKETQKQAGRVLMFTVTKDKIKIGEFESDASYCPFYEKLTHRCNIHSVRPLACREYPFLRLDLETFEIRKVSECLLSNGFLNRFADFLLPIDQAKPLIDKIKKDVESKTYFNHYYLPWPAVLAYIGREFSKMEPDGVKLAFDIIKRMDAEKKVLDEKAKRETKEVRKNER
jgi:Fe-S-cluster containining protein